MEEVEGHVGNMLVGVTYGIDECVVRIRPVGGEGGSGSGSNKVDK